jgi:hypothetical protein
MNERIESYLKQHFCRDYFNSYGDSVEDEHYFMYREEVDGLIELIVRECLSKIEDERYVIPDFIINRVKQHFGVES